jgi:hypothetical protein
MRMPILIATLVVTVAASVLEAQRSAPSVAFRLAEPDMISEDIAYDSARDRFFVSSVRRGGIDVVSATGGSHTFVPPGEGESWGMFAVGVDAARGALWATSAALPMAARYEAGDAGKSALLEFDLATGALRRRLVAPDSGAHALGDLTIGHDGAVYVSDGQGSGVYALDAGASALRVLVPRGTLRSPQTPALSADGATLFVPDYAKGIAAVDVRSGAVEWVEHPDTLSLKGIDGLYRVGHDLIAVQNGLVPNRLVRLALDSAARHVVGWTVLARGADASDMTHAAFARGAVYYITGSGWDRVGDDGTMKPGSPAEAPVIRRLQLAP